MTRTDPAVSMADADAPPAISPLPLIIAGAVATGVGAAALSWFRTAARERPLEQRTRDRLAVAPATSNAYDTGVG